ncbi:MAG: YbbR-like domain-containing protein [Prevotellaceae bacterium]|nr:YbbR-like domain-containing protein [Prevotellaceae bacterium]
MARIYADVTRKTKDFLLSDKSREFFLFLFFFLVAAGFWLLQTLNNDYEMEFAIPVRLKGVPDHIVLTSDPVNNLHVRVRDKGTVLMNYVLGKRFYPITLDFADYEKTDNRVSVDASQFEKLVRSELKASTRLLSMQPDTLEYIYASGVSKLVPVRLAGSVDAGGQYYLSDTLFTPDSVQVFAPAYVLDTVRAAYTEPLKLEGISDTLRRAVALAPLHGVKFVPASVEMMLPVDIYTEKSVEVPVRGVNFPADKVLRTFPSNIQVTFQVGMSRFRQVGAENLHIYVSYEELLQSGSDKYTVRLKSIPKGVSRVRYNPGQVDFLIEQVKPSNDD